MNENSIWMPRENFALTLDEIHFLFEEFLNTYNGCDDLEVKRTKNEILELRSWITNAAISGKRL